MTCLNSLWSSLGQSSGQIQVLLATIGLIFAAIAALYARNQISLAQAQRSAELKLQLLNSAHEYLTLILELRHTHKTFRDNFYKKFNLNGTELVEGYDYTEDEYFKIIEGLLDDPQYLMENMLKVLKEKDIKISIEQLEGYLHAIHSTGGTLRRGKASLNNHISNLEKRHNHK